VLGSFSSSPTSAASNAASARLENAYKLVTYSQCATTIKWHSPIG